MSRLRPLMLAALLGATAASIAATARGQPIPGVPPRFGGPPGGAVFDPLLPSPEDGTAVPTGPDAAGQTAANPSTPDGLFDPAAAAASAGEPAVVEPAVPEATPDAIEAPPLPDEPRIEFVDDRVRDELEPLGLRAGSFVYLPEVEAVIEHTDNVFAAASERRDDFVFVARPTLAARSDWNRHALEITYAGEYGHFVEYDSEDPSRTELRATGRIDVTEATTVSGEASFTADQEGRGDADVPTDASSPTRRRTLSAGGEGAHRFARLTVALRGAVTQEHYDDSTDATGVEIDNSDRNVTSIDAGLRASYEVSPATSVYGDLAHRDRDYARKFDDDGFARDSGRWTAALGLAFEPTPLIRAEVAVGRVLEEFDDPRLEAIDDVTVDAALRWSVTPLTTVAAAYATTVDATTLAGASAQLTRTASIAVDHELLRELVISSAASSAVSDYRGLPLEEETVTAEVGAAYWMSRYAALVARFAHEVQSSNDPDDPTTIENVLTLGIKLRR